MSKTETLFTRNRDSIYLKQRLCLAQTETLNTTNAQYISPADLHDHIKRRVEGGINVLFSFSIEVLCSLENRPVCCLPQWLHAVSKISFLASTCFAKATRSIC